MNNHHVDPSFVKLLLGLTARQHIVVDAASIELIDVASKVSGRKEESNLVHSEVIEWNGVTGSLNNTHKEMQSVIDQTHND
jgi:hypothetical protein